METTEYSLPELIAKAERYTAASEHCLYDVQCKLRQWLATPEQEQAVLDRLTQGGFVCQSRYAAAFVHDKIRYQGWGRRKIEAALYAKHLDADTIAEALDNADRTDYLDTLRSVAAKKRGATREQLIRFLLQRGFSYSDIQSAQLF